MARFPLIATAVAVLVLGLNALSLSQQEGSGTVIADKVAVEKPTQAESKSASASTASPASFAERLSAAAIERTTRQVRYDPAYVVLDYPGGDVPADTGVCTDVVVRSYRKLGFDLQKLVHEDMRANFSAYPKNWGLKRADKNIDHRRVPNLQTFFKRQGAALPVTDDAADYRVGDLVAWDLNGNNLWHIGVVVAAPPGRPSSAEAGVWFVHNIGAGPVLDSDIFEWIIVGHYRWHPEK